MLDYHCQSGWDRVTVGFALSRAYYTGTIRQMLGLDHGPSFFQAFPNQASTAYPSLFAPEMFSLRTFFWFFSPSNQLSQKTLRLPTLVREGIDCKTFAAALLAQPYTPSTSLSLLSSLSLHSLHILPHHHTTSSSYIILPHHPTLISTLGLLGPANSP